jgi:hypothetical protein
VSFPLYFDENEQVRLAVRLIDAGYDVLTTQAGGRASQRISDSDQLIFATSQGRAIVTHNVNDFYELFREWWNQQKTHAGIIVVSPRKVEVEIYQALIRYQELYPDGIPNLILPI